MKRVRVRPTTKKEKNNQAEVFKEILESFILHTPDSEKQKLIEQYEEEYEKRAIFKEKILSEKKKNYKKKIL